LARSFRIRADSLVSVLVSGHAHDSDAGDLALDVEAEQNAGRIAARKPFKKRFATSLSVFVLLASIHFMRRIDWLATEQFPIASIR
jgi:hypothetical protein